MYKRQHLAIAKSLKDAVIKAGHGCIFVGSTSGQDRSWFEDDDSFESVHFLETSGVVNKRGWRKLSSLLSSLKATLKALSLVKGADAVISVGGFSAAPASFASPSAGAPLFYS